MIAKQSFSLQSELTRRLIKINGKLPDRFLYVSVPEQRLYCIEHDSILYTYPVSTSQFGVGNREGSFQTPQGIHKIREKIGAGAPPGRIFKDRHDTGLNWNVGMEGENLILSRILRLEGLEDTINRGSPIDSYERYIYIHGTNKESDIGTPISHGCICMKNADVIELFDRITEDTVVIID